MKHLFKLTNSVLDTAGMVVHSYTLGRIVKSTLPEGFAGGTIDAMAGRFYTGVTPYTLNMPGAQGLMNLNATLDGLDTKCHLITASAGSLLMEKLPFVHNFSHVPLAFHAAACLSATPVLNIDKLPWIAGGILALDVAHWLTDDQPDHPEL